MCNQVVVVKVLTWSRALACNHTVVGVYMLNTFLQLGPWTGVVLGIFLSVLWAGLYLVRVPDLLNHVTMMVTPIPTSVVGGRHAPISCSAHHGPLYTLSALPAEPRYSRLKRPAVQNKRRVVVSHVCLLRVIMLVLTCAHPHTSFPTM